MQYTVEDLNNLIVHLNKDERSLDQKEKTYDFQGICS